MAVCALIHVPCQVAWPWPGCRCHKRKETHGHPNPRRVTRGDVKEVGGSRFPQDAPGGGRSVPRPKPPDYTGREYKDDQQEFQGVLGMLRWVNKELNMPVLDSVAWLMNVCQILMVGPDLGRLFHFKKSVPWPTWWPATPGPQQHTCAEWGRISSVGGVCHPNHVWRVWCQHPHHLLPQTFYHKRFSRIGIEQECAVVIKRMRPLNACMASEMRRV